MKACIGGVIKSRRISAACGTCVGDRICVQSFGGETCRTQLRRPRNRWDSNIKMELKEVGCEGVDWINLAHDRTSGWLLFTEQ